jgi:hypothetical protein
MFEAGEAEDAQIQTKTLSKRGSKTHESERMRRQCQDIVRTKKERFPEKVQSAGMIS